MLACSRLVLVSLLWVAAAIDPPKQPRVKQISEAEVPPGTKVKKLKEGEVLDLTGGEYERSKKGVSPEVQQMFDAIDTNDPATINAALGASIDINIRGPHGYTPLFLACVSHRLHAVRLLLDRSADVRRRNAQGFSPLDAAAFSGCAPCTRMLLEYGTKRGGVNLHYVHSDGFNALHRAIWGDEPGHTEVVELLLKAGLSPTKQANVPDQGLVSPIDMINENQATRSLLEEWIRKEPQHLAEQCAAEKNRTDSTDSTDSTDVGRTPVEIPPITTSLAEQEEASEEAELDRLFNAPTETKAERRARRRKTRKSSK